MEETEKRRHMASTRASALGRVVSGRRALITIVGVAGIALAPLPASAAPEEPTTSQEAAALIAARGHELEVVTEQFNDAREQLKAEQAEAEAAEAQAATAEAALAGAQDQVTDVARSAYTGNQLGGLEAMLTSGSSTEFLDRVGTLETIADHNNDVLDAAQAADEAATAAQAGAARHAAEAAAKVEEVSAKQADLESQVAEYQADFDRLTSEEKQAALDAAAAAHAVQAPASSGSRAVAAPAAPSGPVTANSASAQSAVDTALAQRGDPYVWAASGPGSFDCSGLMQYAYAAAGVAMPHSSRMQASMGKAVSRADLQPGDLVFFYSPVSHVGMYIGNGQMVHAPTSGDVVKVASIDAMGSITAMRRIAG